ncbi:MAG: cytochrome b/b6 domain-containing protein [Paracoccaceae bacterium]
MTEIRVWDPLVRVFHWSLVLGFGLNALVIDDESKWHLWIGYAVVGLVGVRVLWGLVGSRHARFADFPPSPRAALGQLAEMAGRGAARRHVGHTPLGALMIYNLLLTLAVIGVSGWLMTTDMFWGVEWPEELHEAAVTWAELSVLAHIVAVFVESRRTGVNLPRAMVTGVKRIPSP